MESVAEVQCRCHGIEERHLAVCAEEETDASVRSLAGSAAMISVSGVT
jgi:hypothetical protein